LLNQVLHNLFLQSTLLLVLTGSVQWLQENTQ